MAPGGEIDKAVEKYLVLEVPAPELTPCPEELFKGIRPAFQQVDDLIPG
jgi:hypothetical protein